MISAKKKINKNKVFAYVGIMLFMFGGMGYMLISQVFPDLIVLPSFGGKEAVEASAGPAVDPLVAQEEAAVSSVASGLTGLDVGADTEILQDIAGKEKFTNLTETFPNDCKGFEQEPRCSEQPGNPAPFMLPEYNKDKGNKEAYDAQ